MSLLIATQNMGFSPVNLFMDADLVVKSVIVGLALSSIWVWTIIISFMVKMSGINRKSEAFEREFWGSSDTTISVRLAEGPEGLCRGDGRMAAVHQRQKH